ncbi:polysaccharide chain length determinant protein, PEP-CTERM locus subfamily [Alteromonadaceae bacterium Bs31]|nr:polysaccharide chain length determinant protein, PEP-CTERM locus subfamily [Alteromonadaceae bacterium Bs31]
MYGEEENEQPSITPNFIPALLRYKWYIVLTAIPLAIISAVIVISLPPVYRSEGMVMVETQKIPKELVQTTVTTAAKERIDIIKQRVMTRDKLISVIKKFDYFELDENSPIKAGQVVGSVRRAINVNVITSRSSRRGPQNAIAFQVSFDSRSPAIAHAMANELVTMFLSENIKVRTQFASETTEFLRNEAAKIKQELDTIEAAVAEFKLKNKDSLPEHLSLMNEMRTNSIYRLDTLNRDIRLTEDQLEVLRAQLSIYGDNNSKGGDEALAKAPPSEKLSRLRARYRELSLTYRPEYPDLVALREQIDLLETAAAAEVSEPALSSGSGENQPAQKRVKGLAVELSNLRLDKKELEAEIAKLEERIIKVPLVERGLIDLNRGYRTRLNQYNAITSKIMDASMAESLELSLQAEKFSILEPPMLPRVPVAPDRVILLAAGLAFSLGFPIMIALGLGFLDKTIRNPKDLQKIVGELPVVSIAFIQDEYKNERERGRIRLWFVVAAIAFLIVSLMVHFLVMPIDQIAERALARFGIFIY